MKILNFGSMNIDNVYTVNHMVTAGETLSATAKNVFCGGKGLNQSIAISKAGAHVYHAGIVGEDGAILVDALTRAGIDTSHVVHAEGSSGHTIIQVDRNGQNSIIVFSDDNMHLSEKQLDDILSDFDQNDLILMQNELFNSNIMMEKAAQKGMTIVFNPSPINEKIFDYPLDKVNWFVLNEIEGALLTNGETEPRRILESLRGLYPNANVVLTLGENGAYCMKNESVEFQPAIKVTPIDTTAAGDTFLGYFVAGLAEGSEILSTMERAAFASSITVCRMGAADSIPFKKEVDSLISNSNSSR